ncbi:hypothetical protein ABIA35_007021 [Catenulispora sp. MAP12-49]|uniref:hypothetical protein n=1 Tax=Catenulispora sp. MAP12-49 TaxID=3156302 RepID=UPI00351843C4
MSGVPIFVDASGRRRKLARRASLAAVVVLAGYGGLLAVSFAGGPIPPNALLPVPGIPSGKAQVPASSANAGPSAKPSSGQDAAPAAGSTDHRPGERATTPGGALRQSAPPEPTPTTSEAPTQVPTPTGTSAATSPGNTHGNPTPPGHTRRKSPAPGQSS